MSRGGQNASKFMSETTFEKKQELSKVLGLTEWLCFSCFYGNGESDFKRIEIYTGKTEVRHNKRWSPDYFGYAGDGGTLDWADSIYGNE